MTVAQRRVLTALIAIGLLGAAWNLVTRLRVERANRAVAVAVDYDRVQELSLLAGVTPARALRQLRDEGATHVAIREDTLSDLVSQGAVAIAPSVAPDPQGTLLRPSPEVARRVTDQVLARLPAASRSRRDPAAIVLPGAGAFSSVGAMGVGYAEDALAATRDAGLRVVARPYGEIAPTPASIAASLDAVQQAGARIVVFAGLQVLGASDLIDLTADEFTRRHLEFGYVEMARQVGDAKLASKLKASIIRTHAIAQAEMAKLPPARAVDRFRLAVRERSVRLCYLRPYDAAARDPLAAAREYVRQIAADIRAAGLNTGEPRPFSPVHVSRPALALTLIGVGAATLWLVMLILGLPARWFGGIVAVGVLVCLAAPFASLSLAQTFGALGAAVVLPVLGLCGVQLTEPGGRPRLGRGLLAFIAVSAVSLAAGLMMASCISDLPHMMQLATFRGVKFAQLLPLLAVFAIFLARCTRAYTEVRTETGSGLPEWPALRAGLLEVAVSAVRYWHVVLIMVALAGLAVMVMRSGNTTPVPPSEMELHVRAVLDQTLGVRPRTKEILLGHPALILALTFILAGWRRGAWVGMLLGAIGQVSLVNTFGHIHTPLLISLARVGNGLWVGIVVALVVWIASGPLRSRLCAPPSRPPGREPS